MSFHRPVDDQRATKRGKTKKGLFILAPFLGLVSLLFLFYTKTPEKPPSPPGEQLKAVDGVLEKGQSLSTSLLNKGTSPELVAIIVDQLKPILDFRRSPEGSPYRLVTNEKGELVQFLYEASPEDVYEIKREEGGLKALKQKVVLDRREVLVAGEVVSSLFEAVEGKGEQGQLVMDFVDIFAWDIDFHKQSRAGDRFRIFVEKFYKGDQFVKYGKVLAAQYQGDSKTYTGIYFKDSKGRADYYDPEGNSLRKTFLRSPLRFTRITSGYTRSRRHPVLGGYMPHLAVDYAAPSGTPVWAVADGVVTFAGWAGGNGNSITIRHIQGYSSMYNHLSRFARGIRVGVRVKQKQVIGYVGSTGLSTGPHLDFRLIKGGRFLNPRKQIFIPGRPVPKAERKGFFQVRDELLKKLEKA